MEHEGMPDVPSGISIILPLDETFLCPLKNNTITVAYACHSFYIAYIRFLIQSLYIVSNASEYF